MTSVSEREAHVKIPLTLPHQPCSRPSIQGGGRADEAPRGYRLRCATLGLVATPAGRQNHHHSLRQNPDRHVGFMLASGRDAPSAQQRRANRLEVGAVSSPAVATANAVSARATPTRRHMPHRARSDAHAPPPSAAARAGALDTTRHPTATLAVDLAAAGRSAARRHPPAPIPTRSGRGTLERGIGAGAGRSAQQARRGARPRLPGEPTSHRAPTRPRRRFSALRAPIVHPPRHLAALT